MTLRIMGYHFSSQLTATLNLCRFIPNFLCMCSNSMASAHVIFKYIKLRLRVAVSLKILRVICIYIAYYFSIQVEKYYISRCRYEDVSVAHICNDRTRQAGDDDPSDVTVIYFDGVCNTFSMRKQQ